MFYYSSARRSYIQVETKKKMDRLRICVAVILMVCVFIVNSSVTAADERQAETSKPSLSDILSRNLLSFSTKIKSLSKQARAYFFPASIDFRGANEEAEAAHNEGGSAGQKVKKAVAKSFEESKATVEDSAKSAAKVAKEKLEKSLSSGRAEPPPQSEL